MPKVLVLTSSGGGAHLTVAKNEKNKRPKGSSEVIDIMGLDASAMNQGDPWIPSYSIPLVKMDIFSGSANVEKWNASQKMGGIEGVKKLESLIDYQPIAENIQSDYISKKFKKFLNEHPDVEEIIDTQALSTAEICAVVTEENNKRAKRNPPQVPIRVRKIISEFVTDKAVHYLGPLCRVKAEHAACLCVEVVNDPLKPAYESNQDFYERLNVGHITFEKKKAPLRPEFEIDHVATKKVYLQTHADDSIYGTLKERAFTATALENMSSLNLDKHHFELTKTPQDKIITISLGSQSSLAILKYMDAFIEQVLSTPHGKDERYTLFITTSKNDGSRDTMYAKARLHLSKRMHELKAAGVQWPDSSRIIPLSFQDGQSMASLFQNSDVLITRTGGMSSIEADETQKFNPERRVYVHSEETPKFPDIFPRENFDACYDCLLSGTVRWEGGNAQYLMQSISASFVSPDTVLFGLNAHEKLPSYPASLIQMAGSEALHEKNLERIKACLEHGSNPNMEAIGGLPILAYAKDFQSLECLIQYGGRLTPAIEKHLIKQKAIDSQELKKLKACMNKVAKKRVPDDVKRQFRKVVKQGDTASLQGLLYRYPQLARTKALTYQTKKEEVKHILARAQGAPKLYLEMIRRSESSDSNKLKRLIYLNQDNLNQEYPPGQTALTHCGNAELRKYMVMLGARLAYLSSDVTKIERKELKKLESLYQQRTERLQTVMLESYLKHFSDRTAFYHAVKQHLDTEGSVGAMFSEEIADIVFTELKSAESKTELMGILERIVNFIKYVFGEDILTQRSRKESRNLFFYERHEDGLEDKDDKLNENKDQAPS